MNPAVFGFGTHGEMLPNSQTYVELDKSSKTNGNSGTEDSLSIRENRRIMFRSIVENLQGLLSPAAQVRSVSRDLRPPGQASTNSAGSNGQ
jgi:hypothetical protein